MTMAVAIFVLSSLAILYTYALYPLILMAVSRRKARTSLTPLSGEARGRHTRMGCPFVSVIVPFHNEERWVARKLDNTLSWDYPNDRLEIIAVSDGSTDRTNEILARYGDRVRVVQYLPRQGKPTALNRGVAEAKGDIFVFTDANVLTEPKAIRAMVARFNDSAVGAVSGSVALRADGCAHPLGEGLYMQYERQLYELDSKVKTMVGVDGAFFSVRRELFRPLAPDTIVDDFAIAMQVIAKRKAVVYEPRASGVEIVTPDVRAEYQRKVRMIAGGYQALFRFRHLLNPFQFPMEMFQLVSHKLMRWMVPFFLIAAFGSSLLVAGLHPILAIAAVIQLVFYMLAVLGLASVSLRRWMPAYVPYYFCAVNFAALVGYWRFHCRRQAVLWGRVRP